MNAVNDAIIDAYLDEMDRETAVVEAERKTISRIYNAWLRGYLRGLVSYNEWLSFYVSWPESYTNEVQS